MLDQGNNSTVERILQSQEKQGDDFVKKLNDIQEELKKISSLGKEEVYQRLSKSRMGAYLPQSDRYALEIMWYILTNGDTSTGV